MHSVDPTVTLYHRAVSAQLRGELASAIRGYREILAHAPEHVDARYNLAVALAAQERTDEAMTQYRGVLERRAEFPEALTNLGLLLQMQGRLNEAIENYRASLAIKRIHGPTTISAMHWRRPDASTPPL